MSESDKARGSGTVSLADEQGVKDVLVKSILGLWEVVNGLTRLRPSRTESFRVSIFGSARLKPDTAEYAAVRRLAEALAAMGCQIITGGGPGLMQAANEGAEAAARGNPKQSVGIRIDLPFEQESNPFVQQAFEHGTFFTRLHHFVLASDVFVVTPGGIGTVLEAMMVWQLLQVRHLKGVPLIFVGKMWPELVAWARAHMLRKDSELASAADMEIPLCVGTLDEVVGLVRPLYDEWKKSAKVPS